MKNVALCGAAVPSTLTMVPGADANCWIWFRKDPAMNDAKNTVMTCARARALPLFPLTGSSQSAAEGQCYITSLSGILCDMRSTYAPPR